MSMRGGLAQLWPKVALALVSLVAALFLGELAFRLSAERDDGPSFAQERMDCRRLDALLGGGLKPDCSTRWKRWITDGATERMIFDAQLTTDHWGHRIVPGGLGIGRPNQAVFFGCSFTLGAGLNDDETLPSYFARAAPGFDVYNFASSGFGPQQMLAALTETDLAPVRPKPGRTVAFYVLLDFHIARAVGTYEVVTNFGRYFPYYRLAPDGTLQRSGNFTTGRPWRMWTYDLIAHSQLSFVQSLVQSWSARLSRADAELTAAIVRRSADAFRSKYGSDEFYVVLYPGGARDVEERVISSLETAGIRILDCSDLVDMHAEGARIGDTHPSATTNRAVAEQLAHALGLTPSPTVPVS